MISDDFIPEELCIENLNKTLLVLKFIHSNSEFKKSARNCVEIAEILDFARKLSIPDKEYSKGIKKLKKNEKLSQDHEMLDKTLIRINRNKKVIGYAGGSTECTLPPREGSLLANDKFYQTEKENDQKLLNSSVSFDLTNKNQKELNYARSCHICGSSFKFLDTFYDQLCIVCSSIHHIKRNSFVDMKGKICLVTGARVKIGYTVVLKLLSMGAYVIATTRFPHDAAERYSKHPDFLTFKNRLVIYGLDFRDISMVHYFCSQIKQKYFRLDAIINNAAQTVRRPCQYYEHLLPQESTPITENIKGIISVFDARKQTDGSYLFIENSNVEQSSIMNINIQSDSAKLSQLPLIPSDNTSKQMFPDGLYDRDDQQVDLRVENSWTLKIGEISTVEMIECHVINAFAPWIIISELCSLMKNEEISFIVNVSAMEGQFYRPKSHLHPHTNMAKAALNMLTRTSAAGFANEKIYMTAVDTGWITDENPLDKWDDRKLAPPPLDEIDAAMRIIDPILKGISGEELLWGVFLKNYIPTRW